MDFTDVCRTCLKDEYLNPVFPDSENWYRYSKALLITTGINIEPGDGLPQQICSVCVHFINKSLKFRKSCKDVQMKLSKNVQTDLKNSSEESSIESVKELIVFSGDKLWSSETNIELTQDTLKTEDTNYEAIEEEDEKPLIYLGKDTETFNNGDVSSNTQSYHPANLKLCFTEVKLKQEILKTEYTNYEALEEDDDENLLTYLVKETETCNIVEDVSSNTHHPNDLYLSKETSESKNRRVICKLCQKNLSVRSIDAHMDKVHPGADERKTKCELCDSYVTKEKIARHMNRIHGIKNGQEKSGRCGYCKIEFDSKELLIQHVATCTAKKKKRKVCESSRQLMECDVCNKKMQKASLRLHKAMAHAGMKPVCEHCGRTFANKFRLNEHNRAKHGYDKFKCSFCDFETARRLSMENHNRKHRGEKPFVCDTCGAKFHAAYLLVQHRLSHRTDRPLKCDICAASFKTSNSLSMHKKACHGPAVFKCVVCPKSYSCKHYAVKHMRRAHRFSGPIPELTFSKLTDTQDADIVKS